MAVPPGGELGRRGLWLRGVRSVRRVFFRHRHTAGGRSRPALERQAGPALCLLGDRASHSGPRRSRRRGDGNFEGERIQDDQVPRAPRRTTVGNRRQLLLRGGVRRVHFERWRSPGRDPDRRTQTDPRPPSSTITRARRFHSTRASESRSEHTTDLAIQLDTSNTARLSASRTGHAANARYSV